MMGTHFEHLTGLFIYDQSKFDKPEAAYAAHALSNVEGYSNILEVKSLATMQVILSSVAKALMFTASPYAVVYIDKGLYASDFGYKYLGYPLRDFSKLIQRPDFFSKPDSDGLLGDDYVEIIFNQK